MSVNSIRVESLFNALVVAGGLGTVTGRGAFEFNAEGLRIGIPLGAAVSVCISGDGNQEKSLLVFWFHLRRRLSCRTFSSHHFTSLEALE